MVKCCFAWRMVNETCFSYGNDRDIACVRELDDRDVAELHYLREVLPLICFEKQGAN